MAAPYSERLRKRKVCALQEIPVPSQHQPLTSAEKSARYRKKLKELYPEKDGMRLQQQKVRSCTNRQNFKDHATDEMIEQLRAQIRERVRNSWARKKEEAEKSKDLQSSTKRLTRADNERIEERKKIDRERKQRERAAWSHQKRASMNAKARQRYAGNSTFKHATTVQMVADVAQVQGSCAESEEIKRTPASRRQAVYRIRKALPNNPRKRRQTLSDLLNGERPKVECQLSSLTKGKGKEQRFLNRLLAIKLKALANTKERCARNLLGLSKQIQHSLGRLNTLKLRQP